MTVLPSLKKNWRLWTLACLATLQVCLIYGSTIRTKIAEQVDNRLRYHAIPIALSHLWFDRQYDYAGYKAICHPFQTDMKLETLFETLKTTKAIAKEDYLWVADDRGLADYCIAAFSLFGVSANSLNSFYHVLLLISVVAFLIAYSHNLALLVLLNVYLLSVHVLALGLVNAVPIKDPSCATWTFETVGLHQSRLFDVLGLLCVIHLVLPAWRNEKITVSYVITAVPQAFLLVFLYHCRSSLTWLLLAGMTLWTIGILKLLVHRIRNQELTTASPLASRLVPLGAISACLLALTIHKNSYFHPVYLSGEGPRTIWHNALMGFSYNETLHREYGMKVSDYEIARVVIQFGNENNYREVNKSWTPENVLNSCGNHLRFDWGSYESVARDLFFATIKKEPFNCARCFLWDKPAEIVSLMYQWSNPRLKRFSADPDKKDLAGLNLARWPMLLILALIVAVGIQPKAQSQWRSAFRLVVALLPFSLIASVLFYPSVVSLGGFTVLFIMGCYLGLMRIALRAAEVLRQNQLPTDQSDKTQALPVRVAAASKRAA